jgi:hypothetical protein
MEPQRRGAVEGSAPSWRPWVTGIAAGLSYAYMVWTWGGFIFVGNLVAVHAAVITALGYYSHNLHVAYSPEYLNWQLGAGDGSHPTNPVRAEIATELLVAELGDKVTVIDPAEVSRVSVIPAPCTRTGLTIE